MELCILRSTGTLQFCLEVVNFSMVEVDCTFFDGWRTIGFFCHGTMNRSFREGRTFHSFPPQSVKVHLWDSEALCEERFPLPYGIRQYYAFNNNVPALFSYLPYKRSVFITHHDGKHFVTPLPDYFSSTTRYIWLPLSVFWVQSRITWYSIEL